MNEMTYFLNGSLVNFLFYCHILRESFKCFIAVDGSMEIVECQKIQLKWKI